MKATPYTQPKVSVDCPVSQAERKAIRKIRYGFMAGLAYVLITLLIEYATASFLSQSGFYPTLWRLFCLFILLVLVFGVFFKSRVCALLLLLFFITNTTAHSSWNHPLLPMIILFCLVQSVIGTVQFHKLQNVRSDG
jgi:hypothetical protein